MRGSREGEPGPPPTTAGPNGGAENPMPHRAGGEPGPYCCPGALGCLESVGFGIHSIRYTES
jgi:hypothetical protein